MPPFLALVTPKTVNLVSWSPQRLCKFCGTLLGAGER